MRTRTWIAGFGGRGAIGAHLGGHDGGVGLVDLEYTIPDKQPIVIVLLAFLPD